MKKGLLLCTAAGIIAVLFTALQLPLLNYSEDEPGEDGPEQFARHLYELRVPYGETTDGYVPGYRYAELQKALADAPKNAKQLAWVERGPGNVAGRVRGLVVDPGDPLQKTWFAASVGGGIWKTTDAGNNWTELTRNLPNLATSAIAQAPSNPNILYAGTGESFFSVDVINGDGMYKSTDRGNNWFPLPSTQKKYQFNNISRIVVDPVNPNIVIASATTGRYALNVYNKSGIYKSTDGGASWREVYLETEVGSNGRVKRVLQIIENPDNFNILYAAIERKGVLKSTNRGETWSLVNNGITDVTGRFELAIAPTNTNKVYAAAEGSPNSNLFVTTDAGATWTRTTENGTEPNWLSAQGWYDNTIMVSPTDENTVFVGGVYIYKIVVTGSTRTSARLSTGAVHVDQHNLLAFNGGNPFSILNANDGGLGLSTDGGTTWTKPTRGLNTSQFYGIDKMPGGSAYIGGMQDNGTYRSPVNSSSSSSWTYQIGGDGYEASWHFNDPAKLIGGSQYNGLMRSTNGGSSFTSATTGLADVGSSSAPFITKIAKTNADPDFLCAVGKSGVWRSTDFGANWSLSAIPAADWGSISSFHTVRISKANSNIIWGGARMDASGKIHVSVNKGVTFTAVPAYTVTGMGGISGIATHPTKDSTAYALFSFARKPKILRTTNLGQTWADISGFNADSVSNNGFPDVAVYDLLVMPHSPDTLWAATEIGIFESTNNGGTWHYANNGLPAVCVWQLIHSEDEVVAATHGRGIWSVKIPGAAAYGTYLPLFRDLAQSPSGAITIALNLRSVYDSTIVYVNGARFTKIGATTPPKDTVVSYTPAGTQALAIYARSYKAGTAYTSVTKNITPVTPRAVQAAYSSDFNGATTDFTGSGFSIAAVSGFTTKAIHSTHPYANNVNYLYTLSVPIQVSSSNAFLAYDDVALVEPGEDGTVYGDADFYDYVVVEGTRDGSNWYPLAPGYDARYDDAWLTAYNGNGSGTQSLLRHHEVNLLNTFSAGDVILIRFRLYADAGVTGWGWAVDNLEIQGRLVGVTEAQMLPREFALQQNYPNPFNPETVIRYAVAQPAQVTITVYNSTGEQIAVPVNKQHQSGNYTVTFNARALPSGVYYYRMQAGAFTQTRKMVVVK